MLSVRNYVSPLQRARLFLNYAYVSQPNWEILRLFAGDDFLALKQELAQLSRAELLARFRGVAWAVLERCFGAAPGEIVIPLSGGKDSRLILCMALELGLRERVLAVTWGPPGGLDQKIAHKLASKFGVRHECIDTTAQRVSFSELKQAYDGGADWTDLLLAHFNQLWRKFAADDARAVVGYLCGATVGAHFASGDEDLDFSAAIEVFEALNRKRLGGPCMIPAAGDRLIGPERIALTEQFDLVFRQEGYLRRIVAPERLGAIAPFADPDWVRFAYALPSHCRAGCNLFANFVMRAFPRAFEVGVTGASGLRIDAPSFTRRVRRQVLRASHAVRNAGRQTGYATFEKYGDARDLAHTLVSDVEAPLAYSRALRRRPSNPSKAEAAQWRARAMLICNLACSARSDDGSMQDRAERAGAPLDLEFR
jgi:hypothetical protein